VDTPELRAAYTESLGAVTAFHTKISSDQRLLSRYQALRAQEGRYIEVFADMIPE
jgi:Zn-dependent oligopeptidase